jgi:glycerol-3-phosphate dehydrogenase
MQAASFSNATRRHNLERMAREQFDILVVGGGITGAGVAACAARRGYTVALVERGDFAGGTSSKSSKLVHGGLRYLATGHLSLVAQACRERRALRGLAPHLVWPLPFLLPVYAGGRSRWQIQAAMWLYDALAAFGNVRRHQIWPASRALAHQPALKPDGLLRAACYYDCGVDDARLTLATLLDAHRAGAALVNYAEVVGVLRARGRIAGAQVRDTLNGVALETHARAVVSAVGPWTDALLGRAGAACRPWLRPTKGAHIVVPLRRAPARSAIAFTSPRDGRDMFLVPWNEHAIVGTTDTDYAGSPDGVAASADDVAEILEAAGHALPALGLTERDIVSAYAGVRPLIGEAGVSGVRNSREHRVEEPAPGLVAVAGGKLTTYRAMAREVVDLVARVLSCQPGAAPAPRGVRCPAALPGGDAGDWERYYEQQRAAIGSASGLGPEVACALLRAYGTAARGVLALLDARPELAERIVPDLPAIRAQVVYAVRQEMALTLADVLDRRTHVLALAADQGLGAAEPVADLMAAELGWAPARRDAEVARYRHIVALSRAWRPTNDQVTK